METFPCIICGRSLQRVVEHAEAQPSEGIMCETAGNYGSTVFDSMDGERLAFNICDPCVVTAGKRGRVMTVKKYRVITVPVGPVGNMVVGCEHVKRPYIPWNEDLPRDDEPLRLEVAELDALPGSCELYMPVEEIRRMASSDSRTHS